MATILITGTNKGVGLELTKIYAARGDTVYAACRDPAGASALAEVPGEVVILPLVVGDSGSVTAMAEHLAGVTIDIVINNAGMKGPEFEEQNTYAMDFDGWAETFNVNSMGPVRVMQALMPNLKQAEAAKVVTITSQMGALSLDMPAAHAYCASKAAVNKFMRLASIDLKKDEVAVGLIHPGWVQTDMGGPRADLTPQESAEGIVAVVDQLSMDSTGGFWKWNGETHDW
jgi:NAD(P)-dependent dehydrogenase (short-subunit alcohol dehydrogenase family)